MTVNDLPRVIKERLIRDDIESHEAHARTESLTRYSLSELNFCLRKSWFERTGEWQAKPLDALFKMKMGSLLDQWWCAQFPRRQQRVTHTVEIKGDPEHPSVTVSGIFDVEDEDGAIADLKFMRTLEPTRDKGPGEYYVDQVAFYCHCESRLEGRLHASSHGDFERVDMHFTAEDLRQRMAQIDERARALFCAVRDRYAPEGPRFRWECGGCGYRGLCDKIKADDATQAGGGA